MEKEHIKKIHKMNDDEFMALMEDLSNNSRPPQEQSEFSQELRQSKISTIAYDEPSPSTKITSRKLNHSNSRKMSAKSNSSQDDYSTSSKKSTKSTKSMHDLRDSRNDQPKHTVSASMKGSSAKCIPDLRDTEHRFRLRQESFGKLNNDRKQQRASVNASVQAPTRDNTLDVNNQCDESDPSAGIDFFPTSSPSCCSLAAAHPPTTSLIASVPNTSQSPSTTTTSHSTVSTTAAAAAADSYLSNNCPNNIHHNGHTAASSNHSMNFFSAGNSLHNLQRCVEQINSPSAPIYDSVCRPPPNGNSVNASYRSHNQEEDDSDKMEFGESHNLGHNPRFVEYRRNHSPVNKDVLDCCGRSLLPTPSENNYVSNNSENSKIKRKKNGRKAEPSKKAEEIPGYVGDYDINFLDSFIRGEKNMQELEKEKIKALERGKSSSAANGDKNGGTGTSPENAQDQKKLRKKLKKKLNRDNRSISDRNLLVNKQNGIAQKAKSSSKPVSSNDGSSSDADEPEQISPASPARQAQFQSATLKSQSLFLNDYELVSKAQSQEDLTEYQTVSDPEVEREKEFVTPKGKSFKKNKKISPKAPVAKATVFDSRRGFSKRDLKRDVRINNGTVHSNGYESERDINSFAADSLNLPLKISSRNVLAPTGRTLPIVIDVSDGSRPSKGKPARDNDSQMQRGNIVNGFFPRISDAITVFEPQAPSGNLSYAQIIKNKASASTVAPSNVALATITSPTPVLAEPVAVSPPVVEPSSPSAADSSGSTTTDSAISVSAESSSSVVAESSISPVAIDFSNSAMATDPSSSLAVDCSTSAPVPHSSSPIVVESAAVTAVAECSPSFVTDCSVSTNSVSSQPANPLSSLSPPTPAVKECDSQRVPFMFGNFDNEEIEFLVNDAVIPQLYSAVVPNNAPRDIPNNVPLDISNTVPADIPSNVSLDITEDAPHDITDNIPSDVPDNKLVDSLRMSDLLKMCENLKFVDTIDKNSFNYFAAVNFVKDSWDEFKRVDYQTINTV